MILLAPPSNTGSTCDSAGIFVSACASSSQTQVDIAANEQGKGGVPPRESNTKTRNSLRTAGPTPPEDCGPLNRCIDYSVIGVPDVTLADIASFRPAQPTLAGEPAGFGVVGMPTNLLASASEQRIPGTVLGWDVTVRFVPVAYVFDNGDGTTTRATTGGASWSSLGQGQFTPTATSHVYQARGTYPVSVTVEYEASVDFGSGTWRPVPGVVRAEAAGYGVRVVEVRTALVDRTCVEDPTGPGC
ncbi:hypothetical protein ACWKWN_09035 [Microbacterium trichothecenolyticum]